MPAKPLWYHKIAEIKLSLIEWESEMVDRIAIEGFFSLGRRDASRFLTRFAQRHRRGEAQLARKDRVIAYLDKLMSEGAYANERHRRGVIRQRLREVQERVRVAKQLAQEESAAAEEARRVRSTVPQLERMEALPEGVSVGPGYVRFDFAHPAQAPDKMFQMTDLITRSGKAWREFAAAAALPDSSPSARDLVSGAVGRYEDKNSEVVNYIIR